jgi:hypothetical protein
VSGRVERGKNPLDLDEMAARDGGQLVEAADRP